jgi:nucleoside-diphosphate-sugar epimerase
LAREIIDMTGSRSEIVFRPLPTDDPRVRCPDITRAVRLLGWRPRVSRREGLERTIADFRLRLTTGVQQVTP